MGFLPYLSPGLGFNLSEFSFFQRDYLAPVLYWKTVRVYLKNCGNKWVKETLQDGPEEAAVIWLDQ